MAFQPNPNLFNSAFGGGLRSGSALADLVRNRRRESELERLARGFAQNQDYNALGTGLMGIGMVGPGVNAMQVPYQREQDALTREHQRMVFDANQAHRDRSFEADQSYRAAQLANQRANIGIAQQRLAQASQPNLPSGYMWNDPSDRSAGVSMLPGYTPTQGQETWGAPVRTVDEQGNPTLVQFSNRGNQRPIEGYAPGGTLQKTDAGNETIYTNPITGEVVARVPIDNYQPAFDKAAGAEAGKSEAERQATAPQEYFAANDTLGLIKKIRSHPGIDPGTGASSVIRNRIPGTDAYDFQNLVNQATGTAFLAAVQQMRGLGALSNAEGEAATRAVARIETATSKDAFLDALADYETIVNRGRDRAAKRMQRGAAQSEPIPGQRTTSGGITYTIEN